MAKLTLDEEIDRARFELSSAQTRVYASPHKNQAQQAQYDVIYWQSKLDALLLQKQPYGSGPQPYQGFVHPLQASAIYKQQQYQQYVNYAASALQNPQFQQYVSSAMGPISSVAPWVLGHGNPPWGPPTPPNDNATTLQPTWEELEEVKVINFGKYAGQEITQIPEDYLHWLIDTRKKDIKEYEAELERRALVENANVSVTEAIIKAGYRALAQTLHPDKGGDPKKFQELTAANEQLKMVLAELKNVKGTTA